MRRALVLSVYLQSKTVPELCEVYVVSCSVWFSGVLCAIVKIRYSSYFKVYSVFRDVSGAIFYISGCFVESYHLYLHLLRDVG